MPHHGQPLPIVVYICLGLSELPASCEEWRSSEKQHTTSAVGGYR